MSFKDRSPLAFGILSDWVKYQNSTKAAPTPFTMYHSWLDSHLVQTMAYFGAKRGNFESSWLAVCRVLESATGERTEPAKAKK